MYHHVKKLMYTVRVDEPDPRFGNMLLEQFGGANGELAAAMHATAARLAYYYPGTFWSSMLSQAGAGTGGSRK